jgi:hypothetical protein
MYKEINNVAELYTRIETIEEYLYKIDLIIPELSCKEKMFRISKAQRSLSGVKLEMLEGCMKLYEAIFEYEKEVLNLN